MHSSIVFRIYWMILICEQNVLLRFFVAPILFSTQGRVNYRFKKTSLYSDSVSQANEPDEFLVECLRAKVSKPEKFWNCPFILIAASNTRITLTSRCSISWTFEPELSSFVSQKNKSQISDHRREMWEMGIWRRYIPVSQIVLEVSKRSKASFSVAPPWWYSWKSFWK